jgi:NAD(P)-dependent dehydrogenase (short-subunit alcohol dehydrogenase family)
MDLAGQRVVVVGGTSGIGLATARAAADHGAQVVVVSARAESVENALAQLPEGTTGHAVDVRNVDRVNALFEQIGSLDHLVYTSGEALVLKPLAEIDSDTARGFFETRYFGSLAVVRAAAPRLPASGSITLTSGAAVQRPGPGLLLIASVAGALEAATRALSLELAPVRVNLVRPGVVRTPLWSGMSEQDRSDLYQAQAKILPVRHVGECEELAKTYLYFMSQTYATGTVAVVDGGLMLV